MRRVGRIEQVRIEHRIVLHSSERNPLLAEMVERRFEIMNCFWQSGIFERALHSIGESLGFQRDDRPSPGRIPNRDALYNSSTLILSICVLQSQKPSMFRLGFWLCSTQMERIKVLELYSASRFRIRPGLGRSSRWKTRRSPIE